MNDIVYFAIGDVHGEDDRLAHLHDLIAAEAARFGAPAMILHLGDMVDRGPNSAGVVQRIMDITAAPPPGLSVISLKGNHEAMMLEAMDAANLREQLTWLTMNGGRETLASYLKQQPNSASDQLADMIGPAHLAFLRALPTHYHDQSRKLYFVHAGIEPDDFPDCSDEVRLWTRSRRFMQVELWPHRPELDGLLVVHGHTPNMQRSVEFVGGRRLNLDTGAVFGGALTCAILAPGEPPRFLQA